MSKLLVFCPSYRRPIAAAAVADTFLNTSALPDTKLTFLVFDDDPDACLYLEPPVTTKCNIVLCPEKEMVPRVNGALGLLDGFTHIGWVADDNRFETPGWDSAVIEALGSHPIVFCNDTVSPGAKPSHVFMDARIPKALGWLILPGLHSTFADDVWSNLGAGPIDVTGPLFPDSVFADDGVDRWFAGRRAREHPIYLEKTGLGIGYLDSVRIPHLYIEKTADSHWVTRGKTNYKVHNEDDLDRYRHWLRHEAEDDIAKARRELKGRTLTRA